MKAKELFTKENLEKAVKFGGGLLVGYILVKYGNHSERSYGYKGYIIPTYQSAIDAITSSTMFSSDKNTAMEAIKPGLSQSFYSTVISIVNGKQFSSDKVDAIISIANQFKDSKETK